jgi:hypothetical protein
MTVRSFDWRDLPILHRYRRQYLFFDSVRMLTRGVTFLPAGALLSYLAPATGVFTYLCEANGHPDQPLIGQVSHANGAASARLSFLAPDERLAAADLVPLFEKVASEMIERGAMHILADADDGRAAFGSLHRAGFAIYARQRIWQLGRNPSAARQPVGWRATVEQDVSAVRVLYFNLVPGLVQQVEPPPANRMQGLVYYQDQDLLACVELKYGSQGIWVQPFVHPDAGQSTAELIRWLQTMPDRRSLPVYVCVRSYQSWLEAELEDAGAQPGPQQAVMVKHLAAARRIKQPVALPSLEGTRPEPTVPIANIENEIAYDKTNH